MSAMTVRLGCLGLALMGLSVQAQTQTTVRLNPPIPIAHQVPQAQVTFSGTNPTRVTIFIRPVGETAYQSLEASDNGNNTWSVALPFPMPPQGVDAYTEYVRDGQTLTEPQQNPAQFPFRAPALNLVAQSDITLPARQYRMVTVPLWLETFSGLTFNLGSGEPLDVFGDDFGADGNPTEWRFLRWSPSLLSYVNLLPERVAGVQARAGRRGLQPGEGYWLITADGGTFDVEQGLSTGVTFDGEAAFPTPEPIFLQTGWNQIGSPFLFPIRWDDVQNSGSVEDPIGYAGTYTNPQATLRPWEGYFVYNPGSPTTLFASALPSGENPFRTGSLARRMRARAGAGASVLSVTAESGALEEEVYLGLAESMPSTDRPVHLRKPPPIDEGLRLVVQDAGEDWIGRFQPTDNARWTLALTMPSDDDVRLRLRSEGDWPDGVVVVDLDQGTELEIQGGTVTVPAIASLSTRRLQVRIGDASSQAPAISLGTPWPNPTAGLVTVPYTLHAASQVRLEVLDVLGRTVRVLHDDEQDAGAHAMPWDGADASGRPVAAGIYLVRLEANGKSATARITRLR